MSARLALLCAALALAVAARPAAAFDVCETYGRDECAEHADKCVHCVAWDRVDVCFEAEIAKRLPSKLFSCDWPPPPAPPVEPSPEPQPASPEPQPVAGDCQDYKSEDACTAGDCVWCLSAAVPSSCYTEAEARRLPAAVFKCKFPSLAQQ